MKLTKAQANEMLMKTLNDLNAAFTNKFYLDRETWPTNKRNDSAIPVIVVEPNFKNLKGYRVSTTIPGNLYAEFGTFTEVCDFIRKYI